MSEGGDESKHWLRMLSRADENQKEKYRKFWKEAHELTLIFAKYPSPASSLEIKNYDLFTKL